MKNVFAHYKNGRNVLKGVSFKLYAGDSLLVYGQNGSGKTTLLRVLAGLIPHQDGEILWQGVRASNRSFGTPTFPWVGMLTQRDSVFPNLTVAQNLSLSYDKKTQSFLREYLEMFPEINAASKMRAGLLSGGESKLLALIMFVTKPHPVLLLDEPLTGLSCENVLKVLRILTDRIKQGDTIILVEHSTSNLTQGIISNQVEMVEGVLTKTTA